MTNKKLWVKVLSLVVVICMLCVFFVACGKKDPEPETPTDTSTSAIKQLLNGVKKSVADGDMTALQVGADLDLTVKEGSESTDYSIYFDLILNLYNGSQTTTTSSDNATMLQGEITKGSDVVLGLYYYDDNTKIDGGTTAMDSNSLYMQYKQEGETDNTKIAIPVPYVNGTMKGLDGKVNFSGIDLDDDDTWATVIGYADTIESMACSNVKQTATESYFEINLYEVLGSLGDMLGGVNDYMDALGLAIDATKLSDILPNLVIAVTTTYSDGTIADPGKVTGLNINLKVSDKDIVIKHNDKNSTPFFVIGMDGAIEVNAKLAYKVGETMNQTFHIGNYSDYTDVNLINMKASAGLVLDEDINMSIAINSSTNLTIALLAGTYTLDIGVDADPTKILSQIFTYTQVTTEEFNTTEGYLYFKKVNENLYVRDTSVTAANFSTKVASGIYTRSAKMQFTDSKGNFDITGTISAITTILGCVNSAEITLLRVKDGDGEAITGYSNQVAAEILIANYYDGTTNMGQYADLDLQIVKLGDSKISYTGLPIGDLLDTVGGIIGPLLSSSSSDEEADETLTTLTTVGKYLANAFISLNDKAAGLTGYNHSGLYASVDIAKIPFSGWTQFKGAFNSAYTYYTQDAATYTAATTFDSTKTYYTESEGSYTEAKDITEFAADTTYYTLNDYTYTKVDITAFATGVDYYVPGSDVASEGDYVYGIGIDAELKVNSTNKIYINATVTGLDFIGLPSSLSVTITGNSFSLFNYASGSYNSLTKYGK